MNRGKNILVQLILGGIAVIISEYLIPGVEVSSFFTAILVAALLAILNITIKPVLIILTIPITFLTLGLFLLAINALIILMAGAIIPGFTVDGFWWALLFSLVLSLVNALLGVSFGKDD